MGFSYSRPAGNPGLDSRYLYNRYLPSMEGSYLNMQPEQGSGTGGVAFFGGGVQGTPHFRMIGGMSMDNSGTPGLPDQEDVCFSRTTNREEVEFAITRVSGVYTRAPSANGRGLYMWGKVRSGFGLSASSTNYVEVSIDGTLYKLAIAV